MTHDLDLGAVVVKRFRSYGRGEHRREWRSLLLLDRYAPGLAPRPLSADLDAHPPSVTMSRLPGVPLGGRRLSAEELAGLAAAVDRLHGAVPAAELETMAPSHAHPDRLLPSIRELLARHPGVPAEPSIQAAIGAARGWLSSADAERTRAPALAAPVLGREDHNLPNFLHDGGRTRLVDFEDAGRSDRAMEWAALVEHQAARCTPDADWQPLLDAVEDQARLRDARRFHACFWLATMLPGQRGHDRNPPAARRDRAERLLALL